MEMPAPERRPIPHRVAREPRPPAAIRLPLPKRDRPEPKPPSTQWVWLLDEDKLQDRGIKPETLTEPDLDEDMPDQPATPAGPRRRRRRRGGSRPGSSEPPTS